MITAVVDTESSLRAGLSVAFIHDTGDLKDASFRPQFLANHPENHVKVSSVLEDELLNCTSFKISVAFITDAGVISLKETLNTLAQRGVRGQILTSDYLAFTTPAALRFLMSLPNIELKFFRCRGDAGFHTKGYIFENPEKLHLIIGSSNWTANALATNQEWNALLVSKASGQFATELLAEFESLWNRPESETLTDEAVAQYEALWKGARAARQTLKFTDEAVPAEKLSPNTMQRAFIQKVLTLKASGARRALLISATGTGKTYAAAFAARDMAPRRILFLVHREQIARQAKKSFQRVLGPDRTYGLLSGSQKDMTANCLFATMQTMAKDDVREQFATDAFDLIIIDEVHRAGASSYQKIMDYFAPDFWLGMTASPDRPDGVDIYELFHHNIAYEIRLQTALSEDLLCPFHYFGIADYTVNGVTSDALSSFRFLTCEERVKHILNRTHFYGHSGDRVKGLIFCSTVAECKALSEAFNRCGMRTAALSGSDSQAEREAAIARLVQDDNANALDYILSVDIFNEGVDVPEINQVVLLRPTESPIIFVQQLGRGLRKAPGKEYVVVLDFIGNYEKNFLIPVALSGDRSYDKDNMRRFITVGCRQLPGVSSVHFDEITKERIFRAIDSANTQDLKLLKDSYQILKFKLGRTPTLMDFEAHNSIDITKFFDKCGSYYTFLKTYDSDYQERMSPAAEEVLNFCSSKLGRAQRLSEALVLEDLMAGERPLAARLKAHLSRRGITATPAHLESVKTVLMNRFVRKSEDADRTPHCVFIESDQDGDWRPAAGFMALLRENPLLEDSLTDLVRFMKSRWQKLYANRYRDLDLTLGEKYTYEDVCRLLNWTRNLTAQNIGGYFYDAASKTLPVFINYEKDPNAIAYEDHFESPDTLVALSKTKRRPTSPDADHIYKRKPEDQENRIYLFVRRNKDDKTAKSFYFLGEMSAMGEPSPVTLKSGDAAFEITYRLDTPVRQDIYDYLTQNQS